MAYTDVAEIPGMVAALRATYKKGVTRCAILRYLGFQHNHQQRVIINNKNLSDDPSDITPHHTTDTSSFLEAPTIPIFFRDRGAAA